LFFFSLILLSFNFHSCAGESSYPKGGTEPKGPIDLEVGQTLKIKCFVDDSTSKYSNELLYFERNSEPIDSRYITKEGRSIIWLEMPNMQLGSFSTFCKHNHSGVAYNDVRIGTKPQKVSDFKCFAHNWENMTCQFNAPENNVAVNYNLKYHSAIATGSQFNCSFQPKQNDDLERCTISSQSYRRSHENFKFTLDSHNTLGKLVETFDISNLAVVVPNPVTNITFSNIRSDSVTVSWVTNTVMTAFPKKLDFQFLIENKYSANNIITLYSQNPTLNEHKLDLPFAHTWFAIKMRMKSSLAKNIDEMWSKWTNTSVKTEARRPDNPPEMQIGGFNIGNGGDVYIYWKNLEEQFYNGENFSYIVESDPQPNRITYLYATYSKDRMNYRKNNFITVHSSNEKGKSNKASHLVIPATRLNPPSSIVKTLASEVYNLTWSYPLNTDPNLIESYTVFWCRVKSELPNNCETSINFITRKPWETFYQHHSNESLNFAVAANSKDSTSGMIWSTCTTRNDYDIGNIKTIWIPKVTSTTIEVEWKLDCADQGVVKGYQIEYCPISNPKTLDCEQPSLKVNITESKHTLEQLLPYHTYKIDLRMFSATTMGSPLTDPLVNTTSEAGTFIFLITLIDISIYSLYFIQLQVSSEI
jgi:cytokine receptor domeless